jgi:hypothetical protein
MAYFPKCNFSRQSLQRSQLAQNFPRYCQVILQHREILRVLLRYHFELVMRQQVLHAFAIPLPFQPQLPSLASTPSFSFYW